MYNARKIGILALMAGALLVLIVVMVVIFYGDRQGKIAMTVQTLPGDATVYVDGTKTGHTTYVTPGKHTFSAKKDGFADNSVTLFASQTINTVNIPLEPQSPQAQEWASQSGNNSAYETFSANATQEQGASLNEQYPILTKLPYVDIAGPFAIDYGFADKNDRTKIFILINQSTPDGRKNALKWIRDQGVDPTTLDIRYDEFVNPLTSGATQ